MLEANTILGNNAIILTALKKTLLAAGEPLCAALVAVGGAERYRGQTAQ